MKKGRYCQDCSEPLPTSGRCDCGWSAKGRGKEEIEPYPETCCVDGCENDTKHSFAIGVRRGVTTKAYASDFIWSSAGKYLVRQDCEFIKWATRCDECYLREADIQGITRFKEIEKEVELQKENPPTPKIQKDYAAESRNENEALVEIEGLVVKVAEQVMVKNQEAKNISVGE